MLYRVIMVGTVAVLMMATSSGAQVTRTKVPSTRADRALKIPTTAELIKSGPKAAVETAAEVIGMVRGAQRRTTDLNTLEFTATGTMAEPGAGGTWHDYKIDKLIMAMDFVIPATRFDIRRLGADGRKERQIRVVAGKQAWNEEKPGINGTPVPTTMVDDRLRLAWLTPQGAMWGALAAGDNVALANEVGRLAMSYSLNGEKVKIVFDAGLRPQRVEIQAHSSTYGNTLMQATYLGYKDFEGYLAPFPTKITYKAGMRTILDLIVNNCVVNPYVIFPTPANMNKEIGEQSIPAGPGRSSGAASASTTPRRSDGKPDLKGVWTDRFDGGASSAQSTLEQTKQELASTGGIVSSVMGKSRLGGLLSGEHDGKVTRKGDRNKPMYKPEYWDKVRDMELHSQARDPEFSCMPWGVPRMGEPQQILHEDNQVVFLYSNPSFGNTFRVIPMNRPHDPNRVAQETFKGDSVGRWEGDTLVIDTVGFNDESWLTSRLGYVHSTSLHVIERLTRDGNKMKYEVIIEDPEALLAPWVWNPRTMTLNSNPTAMLPEDLPCSERDEAYTPVR